MSDKLSIIRERAAQLRDQDPELKYRASISLASQQLRDEGNFTQPRRIRRKKARKQNIEEPAKSQKKKRTREKNTSRKPRSAKKTNKLAQSLLNDPDIMKLMK